MDLEQERRRQNIYFRTWTCSIFRAEDGDVIQDGGQGNTVFLNAALQHCPVNKAPTNPVKRSWTRVQQTWTSQSQDTR